MKKILTIIYIFGVCFIASQQKIKVIDAENNQPIPYAKIIFKGKDYYKNTEENGEFTFSKSEEIDKIECFGYEDFLVKSNQNVYSLKPKYKEIENVEILTPRNSTEIKLGNLEKKYHQNIVSEEFKTREIATLFSFNLEQPKILYLKEINFGSVVHNKDYATIKLKIYKNKNNYPNETIYEYIVNCKKGNQINKYKLPNKIIFPKEGIFIGFEWINNEQNSTSNEVWKTVLTNPSLLYKKNKNFYYEKLINQPWKQVNYCGDISMKIILTD